MLSDLLRIEPHAHRVVARTEQLHVAHALQTRQAVLDVEHRVVAQVGHVIAATGGDQVHDHGQVGRALDRRDAQALDLFGQTRLGLRNAVLHKLLRLVGIGAELEGRGQRHQAVGGGLAAHVQHVFHAVQRLFERCGHCLGDHLRVRTGIVSAHHDRGRHDLGVLGDGQRFHRDQPAQHHQH